MALIRKSHVAAHIIKCIKQDRGKVIKCKACRAFYRCLWIVLLVMLHVRVFCVVVAVPCSLLAVVFVVFSHFPRCVLVHIINKGEVGSVKLVLAFQWNILLTLPGWYSVVDLLCFFLSRVCYAFVRVCFL